MAKAATKAQAARINDGPVQPIIDDTDIEPTANERGPQLIDVPKCSHCGSDRVKIVSTQGVRIGSKRWQRQRYRCNDPKCKGNSSLSVVMRGPFGLTVAGDKDAAAMVKLEDHRPAKVRERSQIRFAGA